jgi:hypothetical protein
LRFAGTPKALYGFDPSQLVGRPLAAAVDVFGHWRHQFAEDGSLLTLLAARVMDQAPGQGSGSGVVVGPSWRVGVHLPVKNDDDIAAHAAIMITDAHLAAQVSQSTPVLPAMNQYAAVWLTMLCPISVAMHSCRY